MRTKKLTLVFVNHSTTAFTLLHSDRTRSKDADSLSMPLGVHISLWASRRLQKPSVAGMHQKGHWSYMVWVVDQSANYPMKFP